ncbi:MAG: alcohol dehydrogenase catalytic domain-containing protein [Myxococcales bacterium]|nr:alcohol dehydrogenase catalytic domain-containing protein [Myxococcales bacterium]
MKVIEYRGKGDESVIAVGERPTPQPERLGAGMARVRVQAVGLNRADLLQRKGQYPAPAGYPPDIPGLEFAGVIDALGPAGEDICRAGRSAIACWRSRVAARWPSMSSSRRTNSSRCRLA